MNHAILVSRATAIAALGMVFFLAACASDPDKPPSDMYEEATADSAEINCPVGHILTCESQRTGRIRFGKMGGRNLDSCSCIPENSAGGPTAIPGIN